jgi:hypothetical protein
MGKRYEIEDPSPLAVLLQGQVELVRRDMGTMNATLDTHALDLGQHKRDLEAIGRWQGTVNETLAKLGKPEEPEPEEDEEDPKTQRDWLNIPNDDPELAWEWLYTVRAWHDEEFVVATGRALPACWPWHPRAVRELLILQDHSALVFGSPSTPAASDYLTRFQPAAVARLVGKERDAILARCLKGSQHQEPELGAAEVDPEKLRDYARWWATKREGVPPGVTKL